MRHETYLGVRVVEQLFEVRLCEVGNTDVLHLASVEQLLHLPPGIDKRPITVNLLLVVPIHRGRPVHQVQIQVVGAEVLQALLEALLNVLVAVVVELGGQPDLFTGNARLFDACTDILLVAIGGSGIDVTVALLEGGLDSRSDLVGGGLPGSQTDCGDLRTGVEGEGMPDKI